MASRSAPEGSCHDHHHHPSNDPSFGRSNGSGRGGCGSSPPSPSRRPATSPTRLVGRVDGVGAALLGWRHRRRAHRHWRSGRCLRRRGASPGWIVATAAGFGVGLAAGAALVDYETSLAALVVMGAVCGVAIGLAQVASASLRCAATPLAWTARHRRAVGDRLGRDHRRRHQGRRPMGGVRDLRCARRRRPAERARQPPRARHRRPHRAGGDRWVTSCTSCSAAARPVEPSPPNSRARVWPTRVVNRSGRPVLDGVETLGGDVTDPQFARTAARRCAARCTSASTPALPPLGPRVPTAASTRSSTRPSAAGARLVVLENLYMYGPTGGAPMTESTPVNPTSTKSAVRARMSDELIDAHRPGRVEVVDRTSRRLHRARRDRLGDGRARVRRRARRQEGPDHGSTRHPALLQLRPRHRPQPRAAGEPRLTPSDGCGTSPTRRHAPSERSSPTSTRRSISRPA